MFDSKKFQDFFTLFEFSKKKIQFGCNGTQDPLAISEETNGYKYVPGLLALAEKQLLVDPAALQPATLSQILNQQRGMEIRT